MAEKGFGVKEINLIGASGTPTIESPNNLNLNAVNVAISTNVSIGGTLTVTGNVSVGGTLTYEDVTNIDSVGIVTARDGVVVVGRGVSIAAGGLNVTAGVGTFTADIYANSGQIRKNGTVWLGKDGGDECTYTAGASGGGGDNHLFRTFYGGSTQEIIRFDFGAKIGIAGANYGTSGQVLTSGGSGGAASWSDVSITPTNSDIQVVYAVTANGSSAYRFAGNGVVSTADDPDLYLIRGQKYRFINNSGGSHPFQIREASGGTAYSTGVTNNGAASGNIDFAPTFDSPAQLVYQCTSHSGMVGNIYLKDGTGNETNVGVTTFSGLVHLNQLKKTSGTLDYLAATHNFANAAGSTNYFTVNNTDATLTGSTDGVLNLDTTDARGSFIRFKENGTSKCFVGCGEGLSLGDQDDLGLRATDNIIFRAGSSESMRITSDGRVGINRTNPASNSLLHIQTTNTDSYNVSSAVTNPILTLGGNNGGAANRCVGLAFNGTATNGEAFITLVSESSTEANLHFGMRSGGSRGDRMRISRGGDIGAPSGNNIYNASDERLKENMIELTDGLSKIEELKPISFNWKDGWNKSLDGVTQYGFGAQTTKAVDEILVEPFGSGDVELNGETIENPLRVNEKYIIPLLVKAVQELSAEVAVLKAK